MSVPGNLPEGHPVGWCNIGPRADILCLVKSQLIGPADAMPVWSIVRVVVRCRYRRRGVTAQLIEGAVQYAASRGAPSVETYPVDPRGRLDTTMGFVGTRSMFTKARFEMIGTTDAFASKLPRLRMRRRLDM